MIKKLVLLIFAALLAVLFLLNLVAFFGCHEQFLPLASWLPFALGFVLYALVACAFCKFLGWDFGFAITFVHELNHMVFAALHLRKVSSFNAHESKGGEMTYAGKPTPLIALAPYSVPLVSLPLLPIGALVIESAAPWVAGAVGFTLAFHFHSLKHDFHLGQTDLYIFGLPFSLAFILWLNSVLVPSIAVAATFSFSRLLDFWLAIFAFYKDFVLSIISG